MSPYVCREVQLNQAGRNESAPLQLPRQVNAEVYVCLTCCRSRLPHRLRRAAGTTIMHHRMGEHIIARHACHLQVNAEVLQQVLRYLEYHKVAGRSDKVSRPAYGTPACFSPQRHPLGCAEHRRRARRSMTLPCRSGSVSQLLLPFLFHKVHPPPHTHTTTAPAHRSAASLTSAL